MDKMTETPCYVSKKIYYGRFYFYREDKVATSASLCVSVQYLSSLLTQTPSVLLQLVSRSV